eukprot:jgi/Chlat1/8205/Chrsp76S00615
MASAVAAQTAVSLRREVQGLRLRPTPQPQAGAVRMVVRSKRTIPEGARCDYLGSPTNLIMIASTTIMLFAGRFGLAPAANKRTTAGLKLYDAPIGQSTGDPAGYTGTDVLTHGSIGHLLGVGIVLGLRAIGNL